jgi:2',3'-cyclic-nucleotide 2'-phosphodiesterase (5'-nucleotidase family)
MPDGIFLTECSKNGGMEMKRKTGSFFRRAAAVLAAVTLFSAMAPLPGVTAAAQNNDKIIILHTNDVHCQVDQVLNGNGTDKAVGYASIAAYKKDMEQTYGNDSVALVDAGDFVQGDVIGTVSNGEDLIRIMNQVGYDAAVPGNHEFDFGFDQFEKLRDMADFPYVCCNLTRLSDGGMVMEPYVIRSFGSVKVAFLGITTPESFTKAAPSYFQDGSGNFLYSFAEDDTGEKLYRTVQKNVDEARVQGADYVIALAHLGANNVTPCWSSLAVIKNTSGIDVMLDGHSHEVYNVQAENKNGDPVELVQTGTKSSLLGQVEISRSTGKITCREINYLRTQDPETLQYVKSLEAESAAQTSEKIGTSSVNLTTLNPADGSRQVRSGETNLGDLSADAYRIVLQADVGLMNGGGIRSDLAAGTITMGNIISVFPYNNSVSVIRVTGQQLLDALEFSARSWPAESGGFLQVSGLTYTLDGTVPSSVTVNDKGQFTGVSGARRVKNVMVGGSALDLHKKYTVAGNNYTLLLNGDGYSMFGSNAEIVDDGIMLDTDMLKQYIQTNLGGTVGSEYADPAGQGRITIIK